MEDFEIIRYEEEYFEKTKNFLNDVAINEFGFHEWQNYFDSGKFLQLNTPRDCFWIVLDQEKNVIGSIGLTQDYEGTTAKLHSLYVKNEYRKMGIAKNLYITCEQFAKNNGYETIILHTYIEFAEAIKFYKRRGFKVNNDIESSDGIWYYKKINSQYIWKDYFANLRNKYSMRVSSKEPLIINLDGKNITKGGHFSLLDNTSENGFLSMMEKTVKYFSKRYNCIAIFGTDEVSFIIEEPMTLINDINDKSNKKVDEIISMFSQYFFEYFNSFNTAEKVYWHGECFSIPEGKVRSYIKYKSTSIKNVLTTYFLKKNGIPNAGKIKLQEKINACMQYDSFEPYLKEQIDGYLYYQGEQIDIQEFLNGNIVVVKSKPKAETNSFIDLSSWNE